MLAVRPFLRFLRQHSLPVTPIRTCLTYSRGGAYEGDGKTTVSLVNRDVEDAIIIDSYSTHGFRINSGLFVCGPAVFFPRSILSWDVEGPWDVTPESLSLFWLLEPKPDILVIGVGDKGQTISDEVRLFMNKKRISLEVLDTGAACNAFNYMIADYRNVAAALIPHQNLEIRSDPDLIAAATIKGREHHFYGSSLNEELEKAEWLKTKHFLDTLEELDAGTNKGRNEVEAHDRKEMEEKGMLGPNARHVWLRRGTPGKLLTEGNTKKIPDGSKDSKE